MIDSRPSSPDPPPARAHREPSGELTTPPPVSLKSRRKFWESCFTARSPNNLMISRMVGNGGRRKGPSFPAMRPTREGQASAPRLEGSTPRGRRGLETMARLRGHLIGWRNLPEMTSMTDFLSVPGEYDRVRQRAVQAGCEEGRGRSGRVLWAWRCSPASGRLHRPFKD